MNWKSLEQLECPKCQCSLSKSEWGYNCSNEVCDFKISESRFNEIINSMYQPKFRKPIRDEQEDNLSDLNNL